MKVLAVLALMLPQEAERAGSAPVPQMAPVKASAEMLLQADRRSEGLFASRVLRLEADLLAQRKKLLQERVVRAARSRSVAPVARRVGSTSSRNVSPLAREMENLERDLGAMRGVQDHFLGRVLAAKGDSQRAIDAFERHLQLGQSLRQTDSGLCLAELLQVGDPSEALRNMQGMSADMLQPEMSERFAAMDAWFTDSIRNGLRNKRYPEIRVIDCVGDEEIQRSKKVTVSKITILGFWTHAEAHCRTFVQKLENLRKLNPEYDVVAVSCYRSNDKGKRAAQLAKVKTYHRKHGLSFPIVFVDPLVRRDRYGVRDLPTSFVVTAKGLVVGDAPTSEPWEKLQQLIAKAKKMLKEKPAAEATGDREAKPVGGKSGDK